MMTKVKFKTAYDERKREGFQTTGESLTQQHFAQEADIKTIIKKHDRTGIISHVARGVAQYGDYSEVNEYREALDKVQNAQSMFMLLPSEVRAKFENDPGAFFEFATNPANNEKMVELGLAEAPPSPPADAQSSAKEAEKAQKAQETSDE
jgi:phage internal scaffolding protein